MGRSSGPAGLHRRGAGNMSLIQRSGIEALAMQLETLKVFCDIVETRSFATAASKNFVTPSAVSQVVRMLEQRYGCQLLERTRGNLQLTPAGEVLYQASKEIVHRHQDREARLQALTGVVAGPVRVGTVHSIGLYELAGPLKRFLKAYPQVTLALEYSRANQIYDDASNGNVDL